jgi:hypothetical protein
MKRAAWMDFVLASWLIAFVIFGLGDSTSPTELAGYGVSAILLIIGFEMLETSGSTIGESAVQLVAGVLLTLGPFAFRHSATSLVGFTDFAIGGIAIVMGLAELLAIERRQPEGARGRTVQ